MQVAAEQEIAGLISLAVDDGDTRPDVDRKRNDGWVVKVQPLGKGSNRKGKRMGHYIEFDGVFTCAPTLTPNQVNYLKAFAETRHLKRDATATAQLPDLRRQAVGLPVGDEGGYFVSDDHGHWEGNHHVAPAHYATVLDPSKPPIGQPDLYCKWVPSEDGTSIEWNGAENFDAYLQWLEYLIMHFLQPWGITLNGEVTWQDNWDEFGLIVVRNNVVSTKEGRRIYV